MSLKSLHGNRRVSSIISLKVVFQRVMLVFLCSVLVFTLIMPAETKAWSLFGDGKIQPSALPAQKVETAKDQAIASLSSDSPELKKKEDRTKVRELEDKRTSHSSTYLNKDGTKTVNLPK